MESSFGSNVEHPQLPTLRNIHRSINDTINEIQGKTTRILQDQERDLLKCFRARLAEISDELEKERKKNESGSVEWVSKCKKLTEEVEFLRGNLDKVTEENKLIQKENKKFKRQLKTQNEDREFLIKQLVAVKKENAKLRQYVEQHLSEATIKAEPLPEAGDAEDSDKIESPIMLQRSHNRDSSARPNIPARSSSSMAGTYSFSRPSSQVGSSNRPQSAAAGSKSPTSALPARSNSVASGPIPAPGLKHLAQVTEMEQRYKNVIAKLKVQLETEQSKLRQVKCAYNEEVTNRTELQNVLQNCVEEVWRRERSPAGDRPPSSLEAHTSSSPSLVNPASLSEEQRVALMAKFLAHEQVMKLVFSKIHPSSNSKVDEFSSLAEQSLSPSHLASGATGGFGDSIISSGSMSTRAYAPPDPSDMRINIPTHTHFDKESPSRVGSSNGYASSYSHSPLRHSAVHQQPLLHQSQQQQQQQIPSSATAEERMKWYEERSIIPPQPAPEPPTPEKQIISSVIQTATAQVQADPYLSGRATPLAIGTPKALHAASNRFSGSAAKRPPSATVGRPASRTSFGSAFPFAARS